MSYGAVLHPGGPEDESLLPPRHHSSNRTSTPSAWKSFLSIAFALVVGALCGGVAVVSIVKTGLSSGELLLSAQDAPPLDHDTSTFDNLGADGESPGASQTVREEAALGGTLSGAIGLSCSGSTANQIRVNLGLRDLLKASGRSHKFDFKVFKVSVPDWSVGGSTHCQFATFPSPR
jgi:hypothetical protein